MKTMTGMDFAEHASGKGGRINNWGKDYIEIQAVKGPRAGASIVVSKGPQRPGVVAFIWRVLRWMCLGIVIYSLAIRIP